VEEADVPFSAKKNSKTTTRGGAVWRRPMRPLLPELCLRRRLLRKKKKRWDKRKGRTNNQERACKQINAKKKKVIMKQRKGKSL
jgi:hypothetical protein